MRFPLPSPLRLFNLRLQDYTYHYDHIAPLYPKRQDGPENDADSERTVAPEFKYDPRNPKVMSGERKPQANDTAPH